MTLLELGIGTAWNGTWKVVWNNEVETSSCRGCTPGHLHCDAKLEDRHRHSMDRSASEGICFLRSYASIR